MNVRCSGCGKTYRVDDARLAGKTRIRLRCKACTSVFEVPVPAAASVELATSAAVPVVEAPAPAEPMVCTPEPPTQTEATESADTGAAGKATGTTQTVREGKLLSDSGKLRLGAPEMPTDRRISLAVLSGPEQGRMVSIDRPRVVIGRSDAELVLSDSEISRRHAVIEIYGDRFVVRDLNSTNGTFVGDRKITAEELGNQEEFRVGSSRMMFIVTLPEV